MKGYRSKRPGNCTPSMVNFSDSVTVRIYWVSLILQVTPVHFSHGCHSLIPDLHKMNLWTLHFRKFHVCLFLLEELEVFLTFYLEVQIRSSSYTLGVSVHAVWKYEVVWKSEAWSLSHLIFLHLLLVHCSLCLPVSEIYFPYLECSFFLTAYSVPNHLFYLNATRG